MKLNVILLKIKKRKFSPQCQGAILGGMIKIFYIENQCFQEDKANVIIKLAKNELIS